MARQLLSRRKIRRIEAQLFQMGICLLPRIVKVMVRGNTEHRKDICLEDGSILNLWPDGTIQRSQMQWFRPEPPPDLPQSE